MPAVVTAPPEVALQNCWVCEHQSCKGFISGKITLS